MGRSKIKRAVKLLLVTAVAVCTFKLTIELYASEPTDIDMAGLNHSFCIIPKEINNHNSDGVSRIACTITGVPHTAHRIDGATLVTGKHRLPASDIDGVDFKRYFQFEEEGMIDIEIDFPRQSRFSAIDKIELITPSGTISASLGKAASKIK